VTVFVFSVASADHAASLVFLYWYAKPVAPVGLFHASVTSVSERLVSLIVVGLA
jgi:hypothetical protein